MEYNILICDDDRDIVEALRIYLSAEGYHIFAAYTGREAMETVPARRWSPSSPPTFAPPPPELPHLY